MIKTAKLKVLADLFFSIVSYAIPTLALTFLIQPYMSKCVSGDIYGLFLTEISIVRLCVGILVTSLSSVRLLVNGKYNEQKLTGDFQMFLFVAIIIANIAVTVAVTILTPGKTLVDIILTMIVLTLIMMHDYYAIYYRVVLDFAKLTVANVTCTVGYLIGLFIYTRTLRWQIVFIFGYALSLVYILLTTSFWKEPFKITPLFKFSGNKYKNLAASHALTDTVNYCDKLILYPVLGGHTVSVYNAAAVIGKAIQLLTIPVQKVIISYLVKREELKQKHIVKIIALGVVLFSIAYVIFLFFSDIMISVMYPEFYSEAKAFVWIVLLAMIINTLATFFNVIVMRFVKSNVQVLLSAVQLVSYIGIAFALIGKMNLMAVCVASLISSSLRLLFVVTMLLRSKDLKGMPSK